MGAIGVQLAVAYLNDGALPQETTVPTGFTVVTPDSLADPDVASYLYGLECRPLPMASPTST
jgi:hypothetical protein